MPNKIEKLGSRIADELERVSESFARSMPKVSQQLNNRLTGILATLDVDTLGNIKASTANLRKLTKVRQEINRALLSPAYRKVAADSLSSIEEVGRMQNEYFDLLQKTYNTGGARNAFNNSLTSQAIQEMRDGLLGSGVQIAITDPLMDVIKDNITEQRSLADLVAQTRRFIIGDSSIAPQMEKYARQITTDGLNQYAAQLNKVFTDDLGLQWYRYVGALVSDSRPFCFALVAKEWVHETELGTVSQGVINGVQVSRAGMMPGTNAQNLQVNRGGYNCNHLLLPAADEMVPASLRAKFAAGEPIMIEEIETPRIAKFVPAKTIKEAEKYANDNLALNDVSYNGLSLDQANTMNEVIAENINDGTIRNSSISEIRHPTIEEFLTRKNAFYSTTDTRQFIHYGDKAKELTAAFGRNVFKDNSKDSYYAIMRVINSPTKDGIKLWNDSAITHEIGHIIDSEVDFVRGWVKTQDKALHTRINKWYSNWNKLASDPSNIPSIYARSQTDKLILKKEFFAESFTLYRHGGKHILKPDVVDAIDEMLSINKYITDNNILLPK